MMQATVNGNPVGRTIAEGTVYRNGKPVPQLLVQSNVGLLRYTGVELYALDQPCTCRPPGYDGYDYCRQGCDPACPIC